MRKIANQIQAGIANIREKWSNQKQAMEEGKLRSRQRATFERLLESLPVVIQFYSNLMLKLYDSLDTPLFLSVAKLKLQLKVCQNIAVNANKNQWIETLDAIKTSESGLT